MEQLLQITVALFCVPLAALGLRSVVKPIGMGAALAIAPQGAAGLNTIRDVLGGFFLSCVSMLALQSVARLTKMCLRRSN